MSTQKLKDAVAGAGTGTAVVRAEPKTFPQFLQAHQQEIARALPKHLSADRMARIALTAFRGNEKLQQCDPKSVFASVIILSQLGLEPGVLGQGFLVPYWNARARQFECQAIPGWRGLVDLVTRTGRATVDAQSVFPGDHFVYAKGTRPFIEHTETGDEPENRDKDFTHVYAVGWVRNAEHPKFEVWNRPRVIKHRDKYNKVGDRHYSFDNFEQYAKKVVLLQVLKYMPASPELQNAIDLEAAANREGGQGLDLTNVIDGSWAPVNNDAGDTTAGGDNAGNGAGGGYPAGGTQTEGGGDLAGYVPQFDEKSAIEKIKAQKTKEEVQAVYDVVVRDYEMSKRPLPPAIEPAKNDRVEALAQEASKKK